MVRSLINNIITGLGIGYIAVTISLYFLVGNNSTMTQFIGWLIASVFYGLASVIFNVEKLNDKLISVLHFLVCLAITITTGYFLGYGDSFMGLLKDMGLIFCVIYLVIYSFSYSFYSCSAKKINEKLNKSH